jgi:hypothetical protein
MNQKQITFTEVFKRSLQLWPVRVFARSLICEHLVELHALKLAIGILARDNLFSIPHSLPVVEPY